jgi:hypothetical protein
MVFTVHVYLCDVMQLLSTKFTVMFTVYCYIAHM